MFNGNAVEKWKQAWLDLIGDSNNIWLNVPPISSHLYICFPSTEIIDQLKQSEIYARSCKSANVTVQSSVSKRQ